MFFKFSTSVLIWLLSTNLITISDIEDIKIYNTNEEESYKKHIEEFKSSIKFFIQIYLQNYKKNNSYLKNHWLEDDFLICEKF